MHGNRGRLTILGQTYEFEKIEFKIAPYFQEGNPTIMLFGQPHERSDIERADESPEERALSLRDYEGSELLIRTESRAPEPWLVQVDWLDILKIGFIEELDGQRVHLFRYDRMEDDTLETGTGALSSSGVGQSGDAWWGFERLKIDFRRVEAKTFEVRIQTVLWKGEGDPWNRAKFKVQNTEASAEIFAELEKLEKGWRE